MSALVKNFATEDEATNWALEWLRARDFAVYSVDREPWARPAELARTFGLSTKQIFDRLHHSKCPKTALRTGQSGRLLSVLVTPELMAWLERGAR
jgi:hypothetical protein